MNKEKLQKIFVILTTLFILVQFLGRKYTYMVSGYNLIDIVKYLLVLIISIISLTVAKSESNKIFRTLLITYLVLFSLAVAFKVKGLV